MVINRQTITVIIPLHSLREQGILKLRHVTYTSLIGIIYLQSLISCHKHTEVNIRVPGNALYIV